MDGYNLNNPLNMQQGFPQMNRSNMNTLPLPFPYSGSPQPLRTQNTGLMEMGAQNYLGYHQDIPTWSNNRSQINSNQTEQNCSTNPSLSRNQVNMYHQNKFQQPFAQDKPVMQ